MWNVFHCPIEFQKDQLVSLKRDVGDTEKRIACKDVHFFIFRNCGWAIIGNVGKHLGVRQFSGITMTVFCFFRSCYFMEVPKYNIMINEGAHSSSKMSVFWSKIYEWICVTWAWWLFCHKNVPTHKICATPKLYLMFT